MSGKNYFQLISSFLMGACTGAFLYVTAYAPAYHRTEPGVLSANSELLIIDGFEYGLCDKTDSCSSFQLRSDYTYSFQMSPKEVVQNGRMSAKQAGELFKALISDTREIDAEPHENVCRDFEGQEFTYTVSQKSINYELDTCVTKFYKNKKLQEEFRTVWEFMRNPTATYPAILEKGFSGMLHDRFNQTQ
jgi:hypothetical protein